MHMKQLRQAVDLLADWNVLEIVLDYPAPPIGLIFGRNQGVTACLATACLPIDPTKSVLKWQGEAAGARGDALRVHPRLLGGPPCP